MVYLSRYKNPITLIFITNNNPMTNLDPYTILELEEGFFNFYQATKNNCLPYPAQGEQFLADYAPKLAVVYYNK
jgi:hypothetical protein